MPDQHSIFEEHGGAWWDPGGPFSPLHALNATRLQFMRPYFPSRDKPWSALDMGCGGGLVSEPMARLGANVLGLDTSKSAIQAARDHAEQMNLLIEYRIGSEPPNGVMFDVICALEWVEHVDNPALRLQQLLHALKPGGVLFLSTINRTWQSWLGAIVAAEYIFNWVPRGTHDWGLFLKPSEIADMIYPFVWHELRGISYLKGNWVLSNTFHTNYIGCIKRFGS